MIVKVCGMREPDNLAQLLEVPVDWIGFIFHPASPRYAGESGLGDWIRQQSERFQSRKKVGVFVNAQMDEVLRRLHEYQLDVLQLHGEEQPAYLEELIRFRELGSLRDVRLMKAFRVGPDFDPQTTRAYAGLSDYFLFDTKGDTAGGTGKRFDWAVLQQYSGKTPFLLSGGIGPDALPDLSRFSHPLFAGLDLNSHFELEPGRKDVDSIRAFIQELKKERS